MKPLTVVRRRFTDRHGSAVKPPAGKSAGAETWRPRAALAGVVAACVGVAGVAVAGAGNATPGLEFVQSGHYIYNSTLGTLFHVDGATKNVNAQTPLPGAGPDTVVVQTDKSGYVLAPGRSFEFGKSDLKVADPLVVPVTELPVGLEAAGAAFAVYRQAGRIVRLGDQPLTESTGGRLGDPVVTPTGTLWVHQQDTGQLCQLPLRADRLTCLAQVPIGHTGALTVVGDQAVFVDTTARAMRAVSSKGLGRTMPLDDVDLTARSVIAPNDVAGRVAIVDPEKNQLHLIDAAGLTGDKPARKPVTRRLSPGRYERIASSGSGLALIDDRTGTLVTLDRDGRQKDVQKIPPPSAGAKVRPDARPGLFRGADSRLYVDSKAGEHVMVVDEGGDVTPVPAVGAKPGKPADDPSITPPPAPSTTPTQRPTQRPTTRPTQHQPSTPPRTSETTKAPDPGKDPTREPAQEHTRKPVAPPPPKSTPPVQAGRPGAPGSVAGKAGDGSVTVSWRPAAANGAAISQYVVTWGGGSRTLTGSARKVTITGLQNGSRYTFTVRAGNRVGTGPGVNTTGLYPGAAAEAPQGLNADPAAGRIALSWQRPDLNGGDLVRYEVDLAGGGSSTSKNVTGTTTSWSGLRNGTRYQLTVRAITRSPAGKTLTGRPSTISATPVADPAPAPRLTVSRGADATYANCDEPSCAFILIRASGLRPDTDYTFKPYTSEWGNFNGGATLRTDSRGSIVIDDRFPCDAAGQQVWVTASGPDGTVTSAKITWPPR